MIIIRRAADHFHSNHDWLESFHHFSFNDFYDPQNIQWASLRVVNEDVIQPSEGFPFHSHDNMEIVTYVISGALTHEDSLGNKGVIKPGIVQRMSAGTGIQHAEYNASETTPVHLFQMWVLPQKRGIPPGWEEQQIDASVKNTPVCVASPAGKGGALTLHQQASFWVLHVEKGKTISFNPEYSHQYVVLVDGEVDVNGKRLRSHDAARIQDEKSLSFYAENDSHVIWWDLIDSGH